MTQVKSVWPSKSNPEAYEESFMPGSVRIIALLMGLLCLSGLGLAQQRTAEDEAFVLTERGYSILATGDPTKAEEAFRAALAVKADFAEAHHGLGMALARQGRSGAALRSFEAAVRLAPDDAILQASLGRQAWELSRFASTESRTETRLSPSDYRGMALEAFRRAVELRPESFELRLEFAQMNLEAGLPLEAVRHAEEAVRLAPSAEEQATARIILGRAMYQTGEEEKARAEFQSAEQLDAGSAESVFAQGELLRSQRRLTEALEKYRLAQELRPDFAPAYAATAEILLEEGRPAEARPALERSVELEPNDWLSRYRLGVLLLGAGEPERGLALIESAARALPDFLPAREQLGLAYLRRGNLDRAAAEAEQMMARQPRAPEGHRLQALVEWRRRDAESALAAAAQALLADPNSVAMLTLQAVALWRLGRKRDARALYEQAGKMSPQVATPEGVCRLIFCDLQDINLVRDFVRKNRWVLIPRPGH